MSLQTTRRHAAPLALSMLICFLATLLPPRAAKADPSDALAPISDGTGGPQGLGTTPPAATAPQALATVNLATGSAGASYAFELPAARGQAQPALSISYDSSRGTGFLGTGWTLDMPSVVRKGVSGQPAFDSPTDLSSGTSTQDDYYIDGQLLVPVCVVAAGGGCATGTALPGERLPEGLGGWIYFRREIDDGARYFLSPDGKTFRCQTKAGNLLEFGHPSDSETSDGIEQPAAGALLATGGRSGVTPVYRWNLVRNRDASGNTVYYVWDTLQSKLPPGSANPGIQYLIDIYDTTIENRFGGFAHHTHLDWELSDSSGASTPYTLVWRATPFALLRDVDVTSATFTSQQRQLVRHYDLRYTNTETQNFLRDVTEYGCPTSTGITENASGTVGTAQVPYICQSLPPTVYTYSPEETPGGGPPTIIPVLYPELAVGRPVPFSWNAGAPYALVDTVGDAVAHYTDATMLGGTGSPPAPDDPQLVFGDWLSDGKLDWMSMNLPAGGEIAHPDIFTPVGNAQSISFNESLGTPFPATNFDRGRSLDVDGDGLTDMTLVPNGTSPFTGYESFFTTRWKDGRTLPFAYSTIATIPNLTDMDPGTWGNDSFRTMADMNGDGLPDLVIVSRDAEFQTISFHVMVGHGDGQYGAVGASCPSNEPCAESPIGLTLTLPGCFTDNTAPTCQAVALCRIPVPGTTYTNTICTSQSPVCFPDPLSQSIVRMGDLNGDGYADFAMLGKNGLVTCLRTGATFADAQWACSARNFTVDLEQGGWPVATDDPRSCESPAYAYQIGTLHADIPHSSMAIADMTGSGVNNVVVFDTEVDPNGYRTQPSVGAYALAPDGSTGTRAGLLTGIVSSTGASTTIAYDWATHYLANQNQGQTMPVPAWIVTDVTTTNGLTGHGLALHRSYAYSNPIYDARDRIFAGFQHVTETSDGDTGSPGSIRKTTFATDSCNAAGTSCTGADSSYYHALRGLPVFVEESDKSSGAMLRTTWNEYKQDANYTGLDGRRALLQWNFRRHVFLWDGETPAPTSVDVIANAPGPHLSLSEPQNGTELLRESNLDEFGNETSAYDYGRVNGNPKDQVVGVTRKWYLPPQDQTGWSYRPRDTTFSEDPGRRPCFKGRGCLSTDRTFHSAYTANGLLQEVKADLDGSVPLPPPPGMTRTAGQPSEASSDGTIELLRYDYDGFGNVTTVVQGGDRCTSLGYDALFSHLPTKTEVDEARCGTRSKRGGVSFLETTRSYDRALGRVTLQIAPSGAHTVAHYDGFGRIVELDAQDPTTPSATSEFAALLADYQDTGPIRRVHFLTIQSVGPHGKLALPVGIYADHYRYLDAFGDTLAALDRVGSDADGMKYTVSGAHTRYQGTGLVSTAYHPLFFTGDASTFPADTFEYGGLQICPPTSVTGCIGSHNPSESLQYDALGRILKSTDFNGNTINMAYHPSTLSTDIQDAEQDAKQTPGGPHNGSMTTVTVDGHGRTTRTKAHLANGPRTGDMTTTYAYQPTGEPTTITQTFPGGSYTRSMAYDSLGRMVLNTEPNSGGWTYAYNDHSELVGTSDARGCGMNLFHDHLGRLVAEDYSTCDPSQHYTTPDLTTGDGTELFNLYDRHSGFLAKSYDRAQVTSYSYDYRDRVQSLQRQVATPAGSPALASRYATSVYTKTLGYDEANRVTSETTGADASELSSVSELTTGYSYEGALLSATTIQHTLLASQTVDETGAITQQVFGDAAATTADLAYYADGALQAYHLHRGKGQWVNTSASYPLPQASDPNTLEAELTNTVIGYDKVNNPTSMADGVTSWPQGMAAATKNASYFDDYRLRQVQISYSPTMSNANGGADAFSWPPYAHEKDSGDDTYPQAGGSTCTRNASEPAELFVRLARKHHKYDGRPKRIFGPVARNDNERQRRGRTPAPDSRRHVGGRPAHRSGVLRHGRTRDLLARPQRCGCSADTATIYLRVGRARSSDECLTRGCGRLEHCDGNLRL